MGCLNRIAKNTGSWRTAFRSRPEIRQEVLQFGETLMNLPEEKARDRENLGLACVNAYLVGEFKAAKGYFDRLNVKDGLPRDAERKLSDLEILPFSFVSLMRAMDGPGGIGLTEAEDRSAQGDLEGARKSLAAAAEALKPGVLTAQTKEKLAELDFRVHYESGEWTPLAARSNEFAWGGQGSQYPEPNYSDWHGDPISVPDRQFWYPLSRDFEVKGEFEAKPRGTIQFEFYVGKRDKRKAYIDESYGLQIHRTKGGALEAELKDCIGGSSIERPKPIKLQARNSFVFTFRDRKVTIVLNGASLWSDYEIPPLDDSELTSFGFCVAPKADFTPENLAIRKLDLERKNAF
jgi:hypothetical protein